MVTYVLILFFHVGLWASTDSNATTNIPGFKSLKECQAAGSEAKKLVSGTKKEVAWVCVKQSQ